MIRKRSSVPCTATLAQEKLSGWIIKDSNSFPNQGQLGPINGDSHANRCEQCHCALQCAWTSSIQKTRKHFTKVSLFILQLSHLGGYAADSGEARIARPGALNSHVENLKRYCDIGHSTQFFQQQGTRHSVPIRKSLTCLLELIGDKKKNYITTHKPTNPALKAAIDVMLDSTIARGVSPVRLPGTASDIALIRPQGYEV
ncbi:hypothetical protein CJF31_00004331 [Rutstroemia sp. NJR-2017a BVV2]|nr:hypothetical protein CJF31_00004331 [Rutstroemia sp. NJR-2017a BVV2]